MNVRSEMFASQGEDEKIKLQVILCMAEVVEDQFKGSNTQPCEDGLFEYSTTISCVASHSS